MDGSCLCGAVWISVPEPPVEVTSCNCGACRRFGALWAYYTEDQVRVTGATVGFGRTDIPDQDGPMLETHHCPTCGCVTHWEGLTGNPRMGVNARLLDGFEVEKVRLHRFDGADTWTRLETIEPTA